MAVVPAPVPVPDAQASDAGQMLTVFPIPCSHEVVGNRNFSVMDICLSPCGMWLAVQFASRIVVYQTATFTERLAIENTNPRGHKRWTGTFSADGTMFATSVSAGDKTTGLCPSDCSVWIFEPNRHPGGSWNQIVQVCPAGMSRVTSADIGTDGVGLVTLLCITLSNSTFELYHIAPGRSALVATQHTQTIPLSCKIGRTVGKRDTYVVIGCKTRVVIFSESDIFAAPEPSKPPRFSFSHAKAVSLQSTQALTDMRRTNISEIISTAGMTPRCFRLTYLFSATNQKTDVNEYAFLRFFHADGALQHLRYTQTAGELMYYVTDSKSRVISDPLMLRMSNVQKCVVSDDGTTLVAHVRSDAGANCLRRYSLAGPRARMLVLIMASRRVSKHLAPGQRALRLPAEIWLLIHTEFLATASFA